MIINRLMTERGYAVSAALVVAHPDDEALWFGGILATVPFEWTVICCSIPDRDPIRAWKFHDACNLLGVHGKVMPFQEAGVYMPVRPGVFEILSEELGFFDLVVTHSAAGEYGHRHHIEIGDWIRRNFTSKAVSGMTGVDRKDVDGEVFEINMTEHDFERKREAIMQYDHYAISDGGITKGEALLRKYERLGLDVEAYVGPA